MDGVKTALSVWGGLAAEWCRLTHGGGHIERDPSGRVNWQCNKCGRWADPVLPICVDTGAPKDPRGCWNVRCQLGGTCCRTAGVGASGHQTFPPTDADGGSKP